MLRSPFEGDKPSRYSFFGVTDGAVVKAKGDSPSVSTSRR